MILCRFSKARRVWSQWVKVATNRISSPSLIALSIETKMWRHWKKYLCTRPSKNSPWNGVMERTAMNNLPNLCWFQLREKTTSSTTRKPIWKVSFKASSSLILPKRRRIRKCSSRLRPSAISSSQLLLHSRSLNSLLRNLRVKMKQSMVGRREVRRSKKRSVQSKHPSSAWHPKKCLNCRKTLASYRSLCLDHH